jgi:AhpD family alkylhydroperoxidase
MRLPLCSSFGQNSEQLPGKAREVAILVVSAKFRCPYELYAHVVLAKPHGISEEKVATIFAEQRTGDLTRSRTVRFGNPERLQTRRRTLRNSMQTTKERNA